jgi:hypothetical protein
MLEFNSREEPLSGSEVVAVVEEMTAQRNEHEA